MLSIAILFLGLVIPTVETDDTLLKLVETRSVMLRTYGANHPKVVELNRTIKDRADSGEIVKLTDAEALLQALLTKRSVLKKRYGLRHPKVMSNADSICIVEHILSGRPPR